MSWASRVRSIRSGAERRFPVLAGLTERLVDGNLLDAGTRLAAQAFLASVPLLFAFAAFAPAAVRDQLRDSLRSMFGLTGASAAELQRVLGGGAPDEVRETTGAVGAFIALVSATSFSRAMARVCERAWGLPRARTRIAAWRWAAWLLFLLLVVFLQAPIRDGFGAGAWLGVPLFFVLATGVWLWTQHLLLAKRITWLPLLPGALLGAAASTALGITAPLYMPGAFDRALAEYGSLGLVLTLLSWLIAVCGAVTFALTIGAVLAREPPLDRWFDPARHPAPGLGPGTEPDGG
ncbi:YhjD/YihY/BrkB family envelope integrity protein [Streptomyces termitum]|uniref:YhjD/YihY/BrkB family envelope integrity protein n=1 Tax=Streptomyces termitum TaxID=67368 RepID=UPI003799574F